MQEQHHVFRELLKMKEMISNLRLYALVDGIQYDREFEEELKDEKGIRSLFNLPEDKKIAFAGPWLLDMEDLPNTWFLKLSKLERKSPAVSWIISDSHFLSIAHHLGSSMMITLPDKQEGIFRFYDCRVLKELPELLSHDQITKLMAFTRRWSFLYDGSWNSYQYDTENALVVSSSAL
ncbi:DUF4123 domain-containing protein [Yersinia mollaretii]|uniref:DUF4123 domain-containing protein n=1 Tax=Yersinia mollaretii TaxID=33060 RepID=UPI001427C7D8|nr:DUF4123 domain-containing protein [Yersinia mollaretii]MDA5533831.1 DUF4123 domain-containing protein [Yersinia mollaretii]NIL01761.1 DUF4123 domain-containing protein [Yersinia mollaretii]